MSLAVCSGEEADDDTAPAMSLPKLCTSKIYIHRVGPNSTTQNLHSTKSANCTRHQHGLLYFLFSFFFNLLDVFLFVLIVFLFLFTDHYASRKRGSSWGLGTTDYRSTRATTIMRRKNNEEEQPTWRPSLFPFFNSLSCHFFVTLHFASIFDNLFSQFIGRAKQTGVEGGEGVGARRFPVVYSVLTVSTNNVHFYNDIPNQPVELFCF